MRPESSMQMTAIVWTTKMNIDFDDEVREFEFRLNIIWLLHEHTTSKFRTEQVNKSFGVNKNKN